MAEKPILFNTDMVRAVLDGRKTQTRRIIKPQPHIPEDVYDLEDGDVVIWRGAVCRMKSPRGMSRFSGELKAVDICPYTPGDVLWVREAWGDYREYFYDNEGFYYLYKADYPDTARAIELPDNEKTDYATHWYLPKWHPSIHMPRQAARIFLRVTDVRAERLQNMSDRDAQKEGIGKLFLDAIAFGDKDYGCMKYCDSKGWIGMEKEQFAHLWDSTIKKADLPLYGWDANPWIWAIEFERMREETP